MPHPTAGLVLRPYYFQRCHKYKLFSSDKYNVYSGILLKEEYMYCWIKSGKNSFRNEMFVSSRNFKINPFFSRGTGEATKRAMKVEEEE